MGPFIVRPRPTGEDEIERIINLLSDQRWRAEHHYSVMTRLHQGTFVSVVYGQYSHLHCHICGWNSTGPLVDRGRSDYHQNLSLHRQQWRRHQAEMAIEERVEVPD